MSHEPLDRSELRARLLAARDTPKELALLPLPPDGERLLITDSHDVTGANDDGFSSRYSFLHRTPRGWVLFDHEGPGVIRLIRTIGFRGRLQLFLDSDPETGAPDVDVPFEEVHAGRHHRFPAHLVADLAKGHGSAWSYVPFAFEKRCTVMAAGEPEEGPHFYTIFSHVFAPGGSPSASARAADPDLREGWTPPPEDAPQAVTSRGEAALAPLTRVVIHDDDGPGMIAGIRIRLRDAAAEALESVFLRATWDADPPEGPISGWQSGPPLHVDAPLGLFFATGSPSPSASGSYQVNHGKIGTQDIPTGRTRPVSVGVGELADGTLYSRFPMPYWKRARVELVNTAPRPAAVIAWEIVARSNPYPPGCGHFRAVYHREDGMLDHRDYAVAELRGSGTYVGCVVRMTSRKDPVRGGFQRGYLEGDARLYIDDARCFQSASTGTEEYFTWGWYDMLPHDRPFAFPTHGYTEHGRDLLDRTTMYRFHFPDRVPFYRSLRFELEHGPTGDWPADYASVAFFYHAERCLLALSDGIDLSDDGSARSHDYAVQGEQHREWRNLVYEGGAQMRLADRQRDAGEEAAVLEGSAHAVEEVRGGCAFRVSVEPSNTGVRLRRTSDGDRPVAAPADVGRSSGGSLPPRGPAPTVPAQVVVVSVDGVAVGTWRVPSRISRACWMEDEFDIDGTHTAGKSSLRIELRCHSGSAWRAATYTVFSRRRAIP